MTGVQTCALPILYKRVFNADCGYSNKNWGPAHKRCNTTETANKAKSAARIRFRVMDIAFLKIYSNCKSLIVRGRERGLLNLLTPVPDEVKPHPNKHCIHLHFFFY